MPETAATNHSMARDRIIQLCCSGRRYGPETFRFSFISQYFIEVLVVRPIRNDKPNSHKALRINIVIVTDIIDLLQLS